MSISEAVSRAGIIDEDMVKELRKWGLPVRDLPKDMMDDPKSAIVAIEEALESKDAVEVRETDLHILKQYLTTQRRGKLHLKSEQGETADFDITFGVARGVVGNEYIIPWKAENIVDMLTNGESYLLDSRRKVYFSAVRELFFGDVKAFIVCTPTKEDHEE